ncbi:hypothetical protein C8R43DRAFT_1231134 [Mycena crocata]|nr:hypothetical protein C8R43DRAFT_1231134 [Mycena crocata]
MFPGFSLPALLVALAATFFPSILRDNVSYTLSRHHRLDTSPVYRRSFYNSAAASAVLDALEGSVAWYTPSNEPYYEPGDATIFALVPHFSYASAGSLLNGADDEYATCLAQSVSVAFQPEYAQTPFMVVSSFSQHDLPGTLPYNEDPFPTGLSFLLAGFTTRARVIWTLAMFTVFLILLSSITGQVSFTEAASAVWAFIMAIGEYLEEQTNTTLAIEDNIPLPPFGVLGLELSYVAVLFDPVTLPLQREDVPLLEDVTNGAPAPILDTPTPPTAPVVESTHSEVLAADDQPTLPVNVAAEAPAPIDDLPVPPTPPIINSTPGQDPVEHVPRGASSISFDTITILLYAMYKVQLYRHAATEYPDGATKFMRDSYAQWAGPEMRRQQEEARRNAVLARMVATTIAAEGPTEVNASADFTFDDAVGELLAIDVDFDGFTTRTASDAPVASASVSTLVEDNESSIVEEAPAATKEVSLLNGDGTTLAALDLGGPSQLAQKDMEPDAPEEPRCRSPRERTSTAPGHLPFTSTTPPSQAPAPLATIAELGPHCIAALDLAGAVELGPQGVNELSASPRSRTSTAPGHLPWAPARAPAAAVLAAAHAPHPTFAARPSSMIMYQTPPVDRPSPLVIYETPRLDVIYSGSGTAPTQQPYVLHDAPQPARTSGIRCAGGSADLIARVEAQLAANRALAAWW